VTDDREIVDAARELIDAEDEMHTLDREYDEAVEADYDFDSQAAALDRAITGRHRYVDARTALVELLDAISGTTDG